MKDIVIEFEQSELDSFNTIIDPEVSEKLMYTSKKLNGDEILLQSILTLSGAIIPFIIQFFINQKKKGKKIKIIRKGVEMIFDNEKEFKKFLNDYLEND